MSPRLTLAMISSHSTPQLSSQSGYLLLSHARSAFDTPAFGFQNSVGRQNQVPMCIAWWPWSRHCRKVSQYQGLARP